MTDTMEASPSLLFLSPVLKASCRNAHLAFVEVIRRLLSVLRISREISAEANRLGQAV
jgi:hypothetical protein